MPASSDMFKWQLQVVEDPGAADFRESLWQVYRLLSAAHYRTRPSDLRMLMENPDLLLVVARCGQRIVGAVLLNREGGLDARLGKQIFLGRRRPRGHLLAQMLTAQAGIADFAEYRGLRVQRIAVSEDCRRRGLGTCLLERALEIAAGSELDYLGASFALDSQHTETLQTIMGKQYNKVEKRRRRVRYLKRKAVAGVHKKVYIAVALIAPMGFRWVRVFVNKKSGPDTIFKIGDQSVLHALTPCVIE